LALLEVTVILADWGQVSSAINILTSGGFQADLNYQCQTGGLPSAWVVPQSVGYANVVAPTSTPADPSPTQPPSPIPIPVYIEPPPSFSGAARHYIFPPFWPTVIAASTPFFFV
jgi:hypothetical protein